MQLKNIKVYFIFGILICICLLFSSCATTKLSGKAEKITVFSPTANGQSNQTVWEGSGSYKWISDTMVEVTFDKKVVAEYIQEQPETTIIANEAYVVITNPK